MNNILNQSSDPNAISLINQQYEESLQKIMTLKEDLNEYQVLIDKLVKNKIPISEVKKFVIDICEFIDKKVDFSEIETDDLKVERPGLIFILLNYYLDLAKGSFKMQEILAKQKNPNSNISTITPQEILMQINQSINHKTDYYKIAELIRNKMRQINRN